jgi:hypothetical protein
MSTTKLPLRTVSLGLTHVIPYIYALFCNENESVLHLFLCCCVPQNVWNVISEISGLPSIVDFKFLGKLWLRGGILELIMS